MSNVYEHGKPNGKLVENFRGFEGTHGVDRIKALAEWGMFDEALNVANACLTLQPNMDNALFNRGVVLTYMGRYGEAIADFDKVVAYTNAAKKPSEYQFEAIYSRGFCNLALGNLKEGFPEFEPRRRHLALLPDGEHYDGTQDLTGKVLFVLGEPNPGDNLLFSRYLHKLNADVALAVPPYLQSLFQHFPGIRLFTKEIRHFDYWCTLMSLATIFETTTETIPPLPTFCLPLENTIRWRPVSKSRRVGLCWSWAENDSNMPLENLAPLFDLQGVEYYCVQDEVKEVDKPAFDRLDIYNMGLKFKTFVDCACAMKSMDLVVTIDSAIAHMAGTLNIPCFVLLPKQKTHWLWGSDKRACPWYPSAHVFRQSAEGDWASVVAEVQKWLVEFFQL